MCVDGDNKIREREEIGKRSEACEKHICSGNVNNISKEEKKMSHALSICLLHIEHDVLSKHSSALCD